MHVFTYVLNSYKIRTDNPKNLNYICFLIVNALQKHLTLKEATRYT